MEGWNYARTLKTSKGAYRETWLNGFMHAFYMHIEKGNQVNDRLTRIKSYRIPRDRSRTNVTYRFPIIIR